MSTAELIKERKELFDNAANFRHNKRTPMFSNFYTWKVFDAGYNLKDALYNYDIMETCVRHFIETYQFDAYNDLGTRNWLRISDAVGGGNYSIDAEGEHLLFKDGNVMFREEYPELIEAMKTGKSPAFYWTKIAPRACRDGITAGELVNAVREMMVYGQFSAKMQEMCISEYGALCSRKSAGALVPFEMIFSALRGIKESSMDLRKNKEQIKEFSEVMWNQALPGLEKAIAQPKVETSYGDVRIGLLAHSIMNRKQFEEIYWPYMKKTVDLCHQHGKTMHVMCEAEVLRFADFLDEIPKGVAIFQLEQDDVFAFRKRLPNIAICGGMPSDLLGNGTTQECVDYAHHLVDTLGDGYIFSTDKMMSYRNDAKRENLLAVTDFLHNYTL